MKICIVKTSSLGDILHTFPVLAYLRKRFPHAQINWVVERPFADVLRAHPDLNTVLEVDTKAWRRHPFSRATWKSFSDVRQKLRQQCYDLLFDLQGNLKSGLITSQVRCSMKVGPNRQAAAEWINPLFTHKHLPLKQGVNVRTSLLKLVQDYFHDGVPFQSTPVQLRLSDTEQEEVTQLFMGLNMGTGPHMLVAPGSIWKNKQLTDSQLLEFLQRVVHQTKAQFLFSWGSQEEHTQALRLSAALPGSQVLSKRFSLPQLSAIIQKMDLLIGMDSLPLHLAAATTSTPTFAFFGPSLAKIYNPEGTQHAVFQGSCPYGMNITTRCPKLRKCPTGACLRQAGGDDLFERFLISLDEGLSPNSRA